jgi:hypothetical protein
MLKFAIKNVYYNGLPVGVPESYPAGAVEYRADSEGKWYEGI